MSQTKSLKSSILFKAPQSKDTSKGANKFVKAKPDKLDSEGEGKPAAPSRGWKKS